MGLYKAGKEFLKYMGKRSDKKNLEKSNKMIEKLEKKHLAKKQKLKDKILAQKTKADGKLTDEEYLTQRAGKDFFKGMKHGGMVIVDRQYLKGK